MRRLALTALGFVMVGVVAMTTSVADPVRGEASLTLDKGFARLLIKTSEDVEPEVTLSGAILLIQFTRPVSLNVDRLAETLPDYIGAARRDPDGTAVRISLNRKVTINPMAAGERLFVDLLPESWTGLPPPLPSDVVRDLAERARNAEKRLRQQSAGPDAAKIPSVRVRASLQPTFARFSFDLPSGVSVSTATSGQRLGLQFTSKLNFDLADARTLAASNIVSIADEEGTGPSLLTFTLAGDTDIHSFREDKTFIIDIGFRTSEKAAMLPAVAPPRVAPAQFPAAQKPAAKTEDRAVIAVQIPEPPRPAAVEIVAVAEPTRRAASAEKTSSDGLRMEFPFREPTAAALFVRNSTAWLVFDSSAAVDLEQLRSEAGSRIADISTYTLPTGQAIRMRLNGSQLASLASDGRSWTVTFADGLKASPQPLAAIRGTDSESRSSVLVAMTGAGSVHRLADPDTGDTLIVVTASVPARGLIRRQDFLEFALLESSHGVVVQQKRDDVTASVDASKVTISRPGGLTLSSVDMLQRRNTPGVRPVFDGQEWREHQQGAFDKRRDALIAGAALLEGDQRRAANLDIARFYMARGLYHEAKGLLDLAISDLKPGTDDPVLLINRAITNILIGRPDEGLKDLSNPNVGGTFDSQLWKGFAFARQEKWAAARERFKNAEFTFATLPAELQRLALMNALMAALEVRDFASAAVYSNDLDTVGVTAGMGPALAVMRGRLAEALGDDPEAARHYHQAATSDDTPSAVDGRLLEIAMQEKRGEIAPDEALRATQTLGVIWRGDSVELRTLQTLVRRYIAASKYSEAFAAARIATELQPNADVARQIQDQSAALFAEIFLGDKGVELAPVEALALFYEYRELTPIGRRGDEMIRGLSDRLVGVDLLDQAAELLQYQIDHRLEGAARAQVASRLAVVYLMNRKPERAIGALRATRTADLAGELRQQRLLLEARAQSDTGRHDLALEIIASMPGREATRLRSDIYWTSRRWRDSAEQIELYYGERWRDPQPLSVIEKSDLMRGAIGYALADDSIGTERFRQRYAPKMASGADRLAFDVAGKPVLGSSSEFTQIARMASTIDTLEGFLRDMRSRFPDGPTRAAAARQQNPSAGPATTASLPKIPSERQASSAR